MVLGATGAIGSVCCRLLAKAFDEVYLGGRNTAKLMALQQSIMKETPGVNIRLTTNPDKYLHEMDVIVTATSGAGKKILDITKVKPGCVITDVARPLDLPAGEVAKRPDVLVIESGEIELPGNPEMKSIGLPPKWSMPVWRKPSFLPLRDGMRCSPSPGYRMGKGSGDLQTGIKAWHEAGGHLRRQRCLHG